MVARKDITNQVFGRLTALRWAGYSRHNSAVWVCICKCGNEIEVTNNALQRKNTKSCGCLAVGPRHECRTDLSGKRFGRLEIIKALEGHIHNRTGWVCRCDCGNITNVATGSLVSGLTKSCGCLRRDNPANIKHGHARHKDRSSEYNTWKHMRSRCLNPNNKQWHYYGGRGIKICQRWLDSYEAFLEDMGPKPKGKRWSIHRKDNDGDYTPDNCKWAQDTEQARNKTTTRYIDTPEGHMGLADTAEHFNINYRTLASRINSGWEHNRAVTEPLGIGRLGRVSPQREDITGQEFGLLVAVRRLATTGKGGSIWLCRCSCGGSAEVLLPNLKQGISQSCGCTKKAKITFNGETKNLKEWSVSTGISYVVLKGRRRKGWSVERMLTEPAHTRTWKVVR